MLLLKLIFQAEQRSQRAPVSSPPWAADRIKHIMTAVGGRSKYSLLCECLVQDLVTCTQVQIAASSALLVKTSILIRELG